MTFVPRMVAVDKFNPVPYDVQKETKKTSGSVITGCPFLHWDDVINGNGEEFDNGALSNFLIGKDFHYHKEIENRNNPFALEVEVSYYLYFSGDKTIKPFILRVTPDCLKQGWTCKYYEDYKTTKESGWRYKFNEYSKGLSHGYKLQLSIQNYAGYVFTGVDVRRGKIVYINKEDPYRMDEMHVGTELFTLQEVEDFIFSQPVITEKESDLRESVRKFKVHSSWLCKWKGCNKCEVYIKGNELEDFEGDY